MFHGEKAKRLLILIGLVLCISVSGQVLASLLKSQETVKEPVVIGSFEMNLEVAGVKDLYAWQVGIVYDPSELKVLEIDSGCFVGEVYPLFVNCTEKLGNLLVGGTLYGNVEGKNSDGELATIVFGYYQQNYDEPEIEASETFLLNSQGQLLSSSKVTLTSTQA